MKISAVLATLLIGLMAIGQYVPVEGGFVIKSKVDSFSTKDVVSNCWCDPTYDDSTGEVISLKPLVYPLPVWKNGAWGQVDKEGNLVMDYQYDHPVLNSEFGFAHVVGYLRSRTFEDPDGGLHLSIRDSAGKELQKFMVNDVHKGSFLASKNGKSWGLLDSKMDTILDFKYVGAHHEGKDFYFSSKGLLSLREDKAGSYFGAVNYKGKTIIPFKWKLMSYIIEDEDHIYVMNEYLKRGYINIKGQTTLPFIYARIPRELTDSNRVHTEKYITFLDKDLKQIGPKYQAFEKKGKLTFYQRNGKWGILDHNYEVVVSHIYSSIIDGPRMKTDKEFKSYIVVKNGLYGLIHLDGDQIIDCKYECLCGLSYYAPESYYIEFQNAGVSYKFDNQGELIEKGGKSGGNCFCE